MSWVSLRVLSEHSYQTQPDRSHKLQPAGHQKCHVILKQRETKLSYYTFSLLNFLLVLHVENYVKKGNVFNYRCI